MHNEVLVTAGLTTYNAIDTVKASIDSILSQNWIHFEIVVVDDCSTDGTLEYILALGKLDSRIKVHSNPKNSGVAVSRNRIIAEAKGEFLAFFDDDDSSEPSRIATQFERIVSYESKMPEQAYVICHSRRKLLYPDGTIRIAPTLGEVACEAAPSGIAVAKHILLGGRVEGGSGACPTCSQMARLSTYKSLGGFDPAFRRSEDTEFNVRVALSGGHFVGVGEPLVTQTMTKTSEKSLEDEHFFSRQLIYKHRSFVEQHGSITFCLAWLDLKQAWLTRQRFNFFSRLIWLLSRFPLLSMRRLFAALPNFALNRAFSRFHLDSGNA